MTDITALLPVRLLLVEDDIESGDALRLMLERRGFSVVLTLDADKALETFSPDTCAGVR